MTLAEIATELGIDERTARRDLANLLAKLIEGLDDVPPDLAVKAIVFVLERENSSLRSTIPRRFSDNAIDAQVDVAHAVDRPSPGSSPIDRRARQLPRRWSKP
ncbi:MAG: hypothetical protein M3619_25580 [Myxococcota bacterium]|nr:hypothetical protein [Myxococcota bacterium]